MSELQEMSIGQIGQMVCRELPEDWQLEIVLENGSAFVRLCRPDGAPFDRVLTDYSETLENIVIEQLNYAKEHREEFE